MADPPVKRYRRDPSPKSEESEEDDSYVPYVSVKERRRQQLVKLGKISETDAKTRVEALKEEEQFSSGTNSDHDVGSGGTGSGGPGTPELARREEQVKEKNKGVSLLEQHKELQAKLLRKVEKVVQFKLSTINLPIH